ncbi:hypothetical protein ACNKCT_003484 [Cronobacter sakazakii]
MLYTYSNLALSENWLNVTIINILDDGMRRILAGNELLKWPDILPQQRKDILRTRYGIKTRIEVFFAEFSKLELEMKQELLKTLRQQSSFPDVFIDDSVCLKIDFFPKNIQTAADELFRFLFEEQLKTLFVGADSLRDYHYKKIYSNLNWRICPFCGLGYLRAPDGPRHALDHYLPISKYPFAGADFRNLPPMCSECNSDFKKNTDILLDDENKRRHCVDPYNGPIFRISLQDSLPFSGEIVDAIQLPKWDIKFIGAPQEQANNWDRIFKVSERYKRDILDKEFRSWLEHFTAWYIKTYNGMNSGDEIAASIPEYIETVIQDGLSDRAFLKKEVFIVINNECNHVERGEDMKSFLSILVQYA